jgi:hypothetical protein
MENEYNLSMDEIRVLCEKSLENREIVIPDTFKSVVLRTRPEIRDIESAGFRTTSVYDPQTFEPIKKFLVGVNIFCHENWLVMGDKASYELMLNDYFKMTYTGMDFVTFKVESLIIPPEKTNQDKFFELFGK